MSDLRVERLKQIPQRANETWQGGLIRLPGWVTGDREKPFRAVTSMWCSLQTEVVGIGKESRPRDEADFAMAVDSLVDFALGPNAGYRPGKLQVNDSALAEHLSGLLAEASIRVEYRRRLLMVERYAEDMARFLFKGRPTPPGYLQGKGVTIDRVRAFADAAEDFYRAAPWEHLNNEDLIEIESPQTEPDFRFSVVLGAGGREFGMGFYRSTEHYWASRDSDDPRQNTLAAGGLWSLTFDDITSIPLADADLWEDHGLPVAGDKAYPVAIRFEPSMRMRRPGADGLAFLEGVMRAVAATTEEEMDSGRWRKQVSTFRGPMEYVLSLPFVLNPPNHREMYEHGLTDRRAMEQFHAQVDRFLEGKDFKNLDEMNEAINKEFAGKPPEPSKYKPRNAAEEAQDLCFQAFDSVGRRRIALARKAIQVCPDCADAYVILAESAATPQKAGECYSAGVEAGKRSLGEAFFRENAGHFWGVSGTRPFMRALCGLAQTQAAAGELDQAVGNYQELLRLNPGDNQGVRYLLLPLLLAQGRLDESERLIADFADDAMATWLYGRALLEFRKGGDGPKARRFLKEAIAANPHAPKYLLGDAEIDGDPDHYAIGSDEEAVICARQYGRSWQAIPGAMDWLRAHAHRPPARKGPRRPDGR